MELKDKNERRTKSSGALSQQIRRKMITKVKPSGKIYSRKFKNLKDE
jgi:hypothetical protein